MLAALMACVVGLSLGWAPAVNATKRQAGNRTARGAAQRSHARVRRHVSKKGAQRNHSPKRRHVAAGARHRRRGSAGVRHHRRHAAPAAGRTTLSASTPPLVFGVYPGGAAGTVGSGRAPLPEDPAKRLSALQQLRPAGKRFVLRLYACYTGTSGFSAAAQVGRDISQYTANGFQAELVLCYRPKDSSASVNVRGFAGFARAAVDQLGSNPGVVSLQVTNEANVTGAPNAADGYYAGAKDALIAGVEGAKAEIKRHAFTQLGVGFNWAYQLGPAEKTFWSYLGKHGGSAFLRALDWVGIDAYPGTWGPALSANLALPAAVRQATVKALSSLRNTYMPLAAVPATVPIHVCESGYPTGPSRSYSDQSVVLRAAVRAVSGYRAAYGVSDYRWFDLRDGNSSSTSFEDQYGLMTDTYDAKPAFGVFQSLVSTL